MNVTIDEFCRRNPEIARNARELVSRRAIKPGPGGRFPEGLLRTAAGFASQEDKLRADGRHRTATTIK